MIAIIIRNCDQLLTIFSSYKYQSLNKPISTSDIECMCRVLNSKPSERLQLCISAN